MLTVFIQSFFISWALLRTLRLSTGNILSAVFFFLGLLLLKHVKNNISEKDRFADALSILFTVFYIAGDYEGICGGLSSKLFCGILLIATAIGLFFLFRAILRCILYYGTTFKFKYYYFDCINDLSSIHFGLIAFGITLLCWLPYLLKNFPGIVTIDGLNQYAQIIGLWEESNHHPWVHTMLIKLFYRIGFFFTNDASYAIAFYTIAQMCFMAFVVSYFLVFLKKFHLNPGWYLGALAFYALLPYQAFFAIAMLKDTLFVGFCLLYTLSLFTLLKEENAKIGTYLMAFFSGVFFCLFRTNGFYAFLLMIPFVIIVFWKKQRTPILALEIATLVVVLVVKGPVMNAFGVIQPDFVENLSIPGQQISRVIMNERPLTEEQAFFINRIMTTSKMAEGYTPYVSDWFKKLVRDGDQEYLKENLGEFAKVYIQLGLTYPGDYLSAYRDQTFGYWFPCTDQVEIAADEGIAPNDFGLSTKPVLNSPLVVKINEIALKLHTMIPGLGILWSVGALFWIVLILLALTWKRGNHKYAILFLPAIAIFLTLMASTPVAYDFRYGYGYVYLLPMYIFLGFSNFQA